MAQWSGKLIDANGRVGTITLDVPDQGGTAEWTVILAERDGSSFPLKGEITVEGELGRQETELRGAEKLAQGGSLNWAFRLSPADPTNFASAAAMGQYTIDALEASKEQLPLSGGVVALWLFK
jgi:hypothetical protein